MPIYETTFLARQELNSQQVDSLASDIENIITSQDGKVLKTEKWGLKTLAYKINKSKKAHYIMIESESPSQMVEELERQMRIHDDVMRFMTLKLDKPSEGPSIMMKSADERNNEKEAA